MVHRAPASFPNVANAGDDEPTVAISRATLRPPPSYAHGQANAYYGQVPVAPHSLAPMAMSSVGERPSYYPSTRSEETMVIRPRSTVTLGVAIAIAGALMGGMVGIAFDARLPGGHAAASLQQPVAPAVQSAQVAQPAAPAVVVASPTVAPPNAMPAAPVAESMIEFTDAPASTAPIVASKSNARAQAPTAAVTKTASRHVVVAKAAQTVAPVKAAPPPSRPTPAPVVATVVKPEPSKSEPSKPEKASKATAGENDESMKLYSAAKDETSLTLGGSN